jgi:pimeloyl-ACP methyl ester carboxylesterase
MSATARRLPHVSARQLRALRLLMRVLQTVSSALAARVAFRLFLTPLRRKLDPGDAAAVAEANLHRFDCNNGDQTRVYEWGKGPRTAVIVHGWGSHAPRFAPLAQALVARGWRVLAFDAPAHGRSPGRTSSLPQFIGALDVVIEKLGPAHALIGHSTGALAIAVRLGSADQTPLVALQKVVLISMPSGAPYLLDSFEQMLGLNAATRRRSRQLFVQRFANEPEHYASLPNAARIQLPTLIVHDRKDDIVPLAHSEPLVARMPNAQLHCTEGMGHSGLLRNPAGIQTIADFLSPSCE